MECQEKIIEITKMNTRGEAVMAGGETRGGSTGGSRIKGDFVAAQMMFDMVQCSIRAANHILDIRLDVAGILYELGCPDGQGSWAQYKRTVLLLDTLGYHCRLLLRQVRQQNGEFVSSVSKGGIYVLPDGRLEHLRKLNQQEIAGLMAVLIIVIFEMIDIEKEEKKGMFIP